MTQSSSKNQNKRKSNFWGKIAGLITILAAIATIVALILPHPEVDNIEKIRNLLEDQKEMSIFKDRTVISDSVLNSNPNLKEIYNLQSEIIQYFMVCDRLSLPSEEISFETKKYVCIQNLKILYELQEISGMINTAAKKIVENNSSLEKYIDMPSLEKVPEDTQSLNNDLVKVNKKLDEATTEEEKIKIIWKLLDSDTVYKALESKKKAYVSIFKACEVVINRNSK